MPMLIVGGLRAWKKELGEDWVVREASEAQRTSAILASPPPEPNKLWTRMKKDPPSLLSPDPSYQNGERTLDEPIGSSQFV